MEKDIHTHEWWLPFLKEYQHSGKTIKDYCKENGFNYEAFYGTFVAIREKPSMMAVVIILKCFRSQ